MSVALPEVAAISVEELSVMFAAELPCEHGKGASSGIHHHPCAVPAAFAITWLCPVGHRFRRMYCTEHKSWWLAGVAEWGGVLCCVDLNSACDELTVPIHVTPLT